MLSSLSVKNLCYSLGDTPLIDHLNITIGHAENCLITGRSGCGKTTLLSLLSGLQCPDAGEILYDNTSLYTLSDKERDHFRKGNIALIFQNFHLIKSLNVMQNILVSGAVSGIKCDEDYANDLLKQLGLVDKKLSTIKSLSIGEQQRVALARALVMRPRWLFCDEPTSALDDRNTQITLDLLQKETQKINASLIIVTHDNRVKDFMSYQHHLEL